MFAADLNTHELLELDPDGGVIRFAGQRALLIDAVAMGLLRKYLVDNFGFTAARTVLTQFGYAHGWRMAEAIREQFKWATSRDWRDAGPRIYALEGLFQLAPGRQDALSTDGARLIESYEAEQHLLHFGQADTSACWTISGLISGYLSRTENTEVFVLEEHCIAQGKPTCHHVARSRDEWSAERAPELRYFEREQLKTSLEASLQQLSSALKATEKKLRARSRAMVQAPRFEHDPLGVVAKSAPMREAVDMACRMAAVDSTILLTGESGAGKERIARLVHAESMRASGPFVAVNCGAIAETLLESELFGHMRGSFTGALQNRAGLFEASHHGTLLLDEVGDISPAMQLKLLRVLQEREVKRVGDNKNRAVDVRVLAATNRDLAQRVLERKFREDLYYRIRVVEIHIPPLRERREDLLSLARILLAEATARLKRKVTGLSPAAADQLLRYDWPGNVRELANVMERAVALARSQRVELEDLPEEIRRATPRSIGVVGGVRRLEAVEKDYILAALDHNAGNQLQTARELGIGSATLYRRLKGYGLIPDRIPNDKRG